MSYPPYDPVSGSPQPQDPFNQQASLGAQPHPHGAAPLPQRTAVPKVFGILSIIFASIIMFFSLFGVVLLAASGPAMEATATMRAQGANAELIEAATDTMMSVYEGIGYQSLCLLICSALLLAVGIGQVKYRAWARQWSVNWGLIALIALVIMVLISIAVIGPAYGRFFALAEQAPGSPHLNMSGFMSSLFGGSTAILMAFFYAPYPILLITFFRSDKVRQAMIS